MATWERVKIGNRVTLWKRLDPAVWYGFDVLYNGSPLKPVTRYQTIEVAEDVFTRYELKEQGEGQ